MTQRVGHARFGRGGLVGLALVVIAAAGAFIVPRAEAVVAGAPADPEVWPWMAAVMEADEPDTYRAHMCTAMQVRPGWYLTAAHCVEEGGRFRSANELQIGFGSVQLSEMAVRVPVRRVVVYPSRRPSGRDGRPFDLALLWTGVAQGVSSPPLAPSWGADAPRIGWVAGWGRSEDGYPNEMRAARVRMLPSQQCRRKFGVPFGAICSVPIRGTAACFGDSGGPLMAFDGAHHLMGIISFSDAKCTVYNAYTDIGTYRTWINQVIRGRISGRVGIPEIGATDLRPISRNRVRASARWCQRGARKHQVVVEFNAVHQSGRRMHTQKVRGRAGGGCWNARADFPPRQITLRGTWRLVVKVHDRTAGLSAVRHDGGAVRVY